MNLENIEIQNPMFIANDSENISFEIDITPRPDEEGEESCNDITIDLKENSSFFYKICCCLNYPNQ